jgi:hypothetical protein
MKRRAQSAHAKDERAKELIETFSRRMCHLANGPVPSRWQLWTLESLRVVTLPQFIQQYMRRPVGRPPVLSEVRRRLQKTVDVKRLELERSTGRKVTIKETIRAWIRESIPKMPVSKLNREAAAVARDYSRALSPEQRRKKSKPGRALQKEVNPNRYSDDWLIRLVGEHNEQNRLARGRKL